MVAIAVAGGLIAGGLSTIGVASAQVRSGSGTTHHERALAAATFTRGGSLRLQQRVIGLALREVSSMVPTGGAYPVPA